VVLVACFCVMSTTPANATSNSIDHLKLYAHSRLIEYKEFQCFNKLITKESQWNYKAKNGSHYGLGQMKSKHYGLLDPYSQIDKTIRYIHKRYKTVCAALVASFKGLVLMSKRGKMATIKAGRRLVSASLNETTTSASSADRLKADCTSITSFQSV